MKASKTHNLKVINPKLAAEWHPAKNGKLRPEDILPASNKRYWWICKKGHEWKAIGWNRLQGKGCPYCSHHKICEETSLAGLYPELIKEWHPDKNGDLDPKKLASKSHEKVWWVCKKGHEWQAMISDRTDGTRCPYCMNRRVSNDNCLATLNPKLAKEWHPTRNGKLTPYDVVPGSEKKVWWQCEDGHVWKTMVCDRKKRGCHDCKFALKRALASRGGSVGRGIAKELTAKLRTPSRIRAKYMNKEIFSNPFRKLRKLK